MKAYVKIGLFVLIAAISPLFFTSHASAYFTIGTDGFGFYPTDATYVDREYYDQYFGTSTELRVRDVADSTASTAGYYSYVHAQRSYLKFGSQDLFSALSGQTITSVKLHMFMSGLTGTDEVNVRKIVPKSGYETYYWWEDKPGSSDGFIWDDQPKVGFGGTYATEVVSGSIVEYIWTGSLDQLIEGWLVSPSSNFGLLLEGDFDGGWNEITSTQYAISNPSQMNEVAAVFYKTTTGYRPYLEVTVAPVPEPSSMLLLGIGLLGAAVFKRKK